ncbi:MAG: hypothetical protein ABJE47_16455 [bacterium]
MLISPYGQIDIGMVARGLADEQVDGPAAGDHPVYAFGCERRSGLKHSIKVTMQTDPGRESLDA